MGEGAFGTVYKVKDKKDPSYECALKILKKEDMNSSNVYALMREVAVLQNSKDCPYISQYFQLYEDEQKYYIRMEICKGGKISKAMNGKKIDEIPCAKYIQ